MKDGHETYGAQRFKCRACRRSFNDRTQTAFARLKTPPSEVQRVLACLDEGIGILGIERVFGHAEATVKRWMLAAARSAAYALGFLLKGIQCAFIQLDELKTWFVFKQNELWIWCAIDCVTKLWLAVHVSKSRSNEECAVFLRKIKRVLAGAPQGASSDGLPSYTSLVPKRWKKTPYAQVVKDYEGQKLVQVRHEQVCKHTVADVEHVLASLKLGAELNTAFIERMNGSTRAGPARFHRRTLKYSKNETCVSAAAVLRQAAYNFIRKQGRRQGGRKDVPLTPAQKAGLVGRPWSWFDLLTFKPTA